MDDTEAISARELEYTAKVLTDLMPEFQSLKKGLRTESPNVRRAVANVLADWAFDPTADMSLEEKRNYLSRAKVELALRSRDFSDLSLPEAEYAVSLLKAELARRGEAV